ncbi:unnamed protein product [Amoebophrya sp. A120]|nr:unnamed protein product [Amoebophrya sp. A120]|eukprot:GSA120T00024011001.1
MYEIYAPTVLVAVLSNPLFRQYNWNVRALGSREPSKQLLVRSFGVAESGKTRYGKHVSQEERGDILLTLVKNCAMKSPATVLNYCALPSEKFLAYKNPHDPNSRTRELAIPRSTLAPLFELKFLWPVVHLLLTKREDCVQVRTLFAPDLFAGWSPFCACLCRGDSQLRLRMMAFLKKHGPLQLRSTTANFWAKVEAFAKDLFDQVQQELRERADVTKEIPLDMPDFALEKTDGGGGAINLSREVSSEVSTTRPASPGEQEVTEGGVENNSTAKGIIGEETEAVEKNEEQAVVELQGAAENECLSDEDEPEEVQQNRLTGKWWSSRRMPALDFGACDRGSYVRDKEGYNLEMSRDEGVWQIVSFRLWISLAYLWQPKPEKRPITFRSLLAMEVSDSD